MKKLLISAWLLGALSSAEAAFTDNQSAALELGQESMLLNLPNQQPWTMENPPPTASTLLWPGGLIVADSKLLVADYLNNRVLVYDPLPVENGEAAAVVIGQPDMLHGELNQDPTGMDPNVPYSYTDWRADDVFYAEGQLLVADAFNNRVMIFDEVPAWNNASCQYVIGQPEAEGYLVANQGLVGGYAEAYTLYEPRRICVDGGKVFVADRFNHRVLIYDSIPAWNNHSASVVIGQPDFIENDINQDYPCGDGSKGCPARNTLQEPCGVYARDGMLFISDTYNHRVLIYNSIPTWNNATADVVIGQADFFSGRPNRGLGGAYADTLDEPFGSVFYDGTRLFIPDSGNNRVLIYNSLPTENGQSADVVLGQPTMRDSFVNQYPPGPSPPPTPSGTVAPTTIPTPPPLPTSRTMYWPDGVFYQDGRLYVSDTHNNRVLMFLEFTPTPTPSPRPSATPSASPSPGCTPSPSASPTSTPRRSPTPTPSPSPPPSPSPTATSSPSPSPTATPSPSPSPTPSSSPTPSAPPSATPTPTPSPTPSPRPSSTPTRTPLPRSGAVTGDYDGDGTSDIAVFRSGSGLWLIRNVTRVYFGASTDLPVPRDYNGDGTWDPSVFRPGSGKWMVRGGETIYFGSSTDTVVPADYDGDGTDVPALYRAASGKWLVRGGAAVYFGGAADIPVPSDYDGDGSVDIAVFRPAAGKWMVLGGGTVYFGAASDTVLPADYDGDATADPAVFRPANGKWMVRNGLSAYFGSSSDDPVPADYDGDGSTDIAIFRPASGKWMVRGGLAAYYGGTADEPVTNPWPRQ